MRATTLWLAGRMIFLITSDSKEIHHGGGCWTRPSIRSRGCTKFRIEGAIWRGLRIDQLRIIVVVLLQFIIFCRGKGKSTNVDGGHASHKLARSARFDHRISRASVPPPPVLVIRTSPN